MYCENCGKEMQSGYKYCTKCGYSTSSEHMGTQRKGESSEEKWWYRLLKVFYVIAYIPLPFLLWLVWTENYSSYDYYTRVTTETPGEAFWYSLLTLVIYLSVFRLVKIAVLYIAVGQKPQWSSEFKKLF